MIHTHALPCIHKREFSWRNTQNYIIYIVIPKLLLLSSTHCHVSSDLDYTSRRSTSGISSPYCEQNAIREPHTSYHLIILSVGIILEFWKLLKHFGVFENFSTIGLRWIIHYMSWTVKERNWSSTVSVNTKAQWVN